MAGKRRQPRGEGRIGDEPRSLDSPEERLEAARELVRSDAFRGVITDFLAIPGVGELIGGGGGDVVKGATELVKWIFEPVKYEDFMREKRDNQLDGGTTKQGESKAKLPRVTARVESAKCVRRGWLAITFVVEADAGAGNDDITDVGLGVLSPRCRGFIANPTHRFASEEEHQSHRFTIEVKCSDLILEQTTPLDVSVWVEVSATDDEGRQRQTRLRLSSPALDDAASECCV